MIKLNFTEKELETLKDYFQTELYKAEQKIDGIRGMLEKVGKKFGKSLKSVEAPAKKKRGKAKAAATVTAVEKKKPGRKPKAAAAPVAEKKEGAKRGRPAKKAAVAAKPVKKTTAKKVTKKAVVKKAARK